MKYEQNLLFFTHISLAYRKMPSRVSVLEVQFGIITYSQTIEIIANVLCFILEKESYASKKGRENFYFHFHKAMQMLI